MNHRDCSKDMSFSVIREGNFFFAELLGGDGGGGVTRLHRS